MEKNKEGSVMISLNTMTPSEQAFMAKRMPRQYARLQIHHEETKEQRRLEAVKNAAMMEMKRREALERWHPKMERMFTDIIRLQDIKAAYKPFARYSWDEMISPRRSSKLVKERHPIMWLAKKYTGKSLPEIGRWLNRDHSTILHGIRKVDANFEDYRWLIERIERRLEVV